MRTRNILAAGTSLLLVWWPTAGRAQETNAPAPAIPATVTVGETSKDIDIAGRDKDALLVRPRGGPEGAATTLKLSSIQSGDFELTIDRGVVDRAMVEERWRDAAITLLPAVKPILPYLDIPENNGLEFVMMLGQSLMKTARESANAGGADATRATNLFLNAWQIYKAASTATWSPDAEIAKLHAVQCLISIGDLKTAAKDLDKVRVPEMGDESMGLYWLTTAQLEYARSKVRPAMNAAIKSVVFDNKNIETFPDALFMTGRCYEDMLEWYRARDVYFEIAKLFPRTDYAAVATEKLKFLMAKGVTKAKEVSPIEVIFFGLDEDVNARVEQLLAEKQGPAEEATHDLDKDVAEAVKSISTNKVKKAEGPTQ